MRSILALVVVALILAACGGSGSDISADPAPAEAAEQAVLASPLEAELGFASEPGLRQYQLIALQRNADAMMVQCMQTAGFFYAVGRSEAAFRSGAFVGDGSLEWTTANGLGITTSFVEALTTDTLQSAPDPAASNLDYVASLTSEQAAQYDLALLGEVVADPATSAFEPAGCWGDSFTGILRTVALIDEFEPELATLNERLESDPRVLGFQQEWSACMSGADYRYTSELAMVDDVYARLLDIELVTTDTGTQVASPEALEALATFEREVARASYDCRQSFASDLASLRYDYEQEFLDDNRFRIADLLPPESVD